MPWSQTGALLLHQCCSQRCLIVLTTVACCGGFFSFFFPCGWTLLDASVAPPPPKIYIKATLGGPRDVPAGPVQQLRHHFGSLQLQPPHRRAPRVMCLMDWRSFLVFFPLCDCNRCCAQLRRSVFPYFVSGFFSPRYEKNWKRRVHYQTHVGKDSPAWGDRADEVVWRGNVGCAIGCGRQGRSVPPVHAHDRFASGNAPPRNCEPWRLYGSAALSARLR